MPDRIIRDELLDSDRYNELSSDTARLLFVHLLLVADDGGNTEATPLFIRKRLLCHPISDEAVAKLIGELHDCDLIRVYHVGSKRYVHVPRFRQRLRSYKRINPRPPPEVECNEIKELFENLSDKCRTDVGHTTDTCQAPAGEEKGREEKGRKERRKAVPLPEDFKISERVKDWAIANGHHDLDRYLTIFVGRFRASGKTYVDWDAAFMNAVREDWYGLRDKAPPTKAKRID